ncbi:putative peptide-transporting ATPase ABC transporter, membrane component, C_term Response regulator receiver domain [Cupriavidus taiwanensis]|uniref:ABC transporter transmembrane domain-containing protein n=1 Tax=Cupriavidus taiwanensis TaxID=164546 RepID=UPI000E18CFD4|nr:ABC transporter transmembrane domain-containing protein [Cupriavidus taiwanensis]SPA13643.1 putative peptide-transporting ATPase ABC transporter, membrane component, C_term Response regulator receiver domain [Cupriavidus taiwanensis]
MPQTIRPASRRRIAAELFRAIWRFRARVLIAVSLLLLAKACAVAVPLLLKLVVDEVTPAAAGTDAARLGLVAMPVFLVLAYAILRLLGNAFSELRDVVFAYVTQSTVAGFMERAFAHLHALGARFHAQRATGSVIRDLEKGTAAIGFLLGVAVFTIVPTLMEIVSVLAIMVGAYGAAFAAIILGVFVLYAGFTYVFTQRRMRVQRQVNAVEATTNSKVVDSLLNYDTVKFFARESFETRRLSEMLQRWIGISVENQYALSALHIGQSLCIAVGVGAVMLLATQRVIQGSLSVGDLVLINAYIIQVVLPLNTLGFIFRESNDAMTNVERLFALLDAHGKPGEDSDAPAARPLRVSRGEIVFDRVNFSYDPSHQTLWDVSFRAGAGQTVAVVGGSGSGKSTLARLLFRLYQPDSGSISIDGQDLRLVTQRSLRELIGIVPQDTILFNDTIAYNIGYGREGATRADIVAAARAAQLDAFIDRLPDGYETQVGERGVRLSGGERQRVAIARAMLKRPPIVVFDEATSALDTRSERAIQQELSEVARGRTALIIAHRLSTIVDADRILVMEHGRIVEDGNHATLLERGGIYTQMWQLQQQQRELERAERRLALQPVRLEILLASVVDGLRELIAERHINLFTVQSESELRVTGDPGVLQKAIWELCQHMIATIEPGGRLELRLERLDGQAGLRLSATPGELPLPDVQGLHEWLAEHGVTLTADGSAHAYQLLMPMRAVQEPEPRRAPAAATGAAPGAGLVPEAPEVPEAPDAQALKGLRVLLLDDDEPTREVLSASLEDYGAHAIAQQRGDDVIALLAGTHPGQWPQVLLCDLALDEEDGYTVLRRVRRLEAQMQVPLGKRMTAIALSGHAEPQDRMRALMAGFQLHLSKPVRVGELVAAIRSLAVRSTQDAQEA